MDRSFQYDSHYGLACNSDSEVLKMKSSWLTLHKSMVLQSVQQIAPVEFALCPGSRFSEHACKGAMANCQTDVWSGIQTQHQQLLTFFVPRHYQKCTQAVSVVFLSAIYSCIPEPLLPDHLLNLHLWHL